MANETTADLREREYQFYLDIAERIAPTWEKRPRRDRGVLGAGPPVDAARARSTGRETRSSSLRQGLATLASRRPTSSVWSGHLITSDFSPAMLDAARRRGAELGPRECRLSGDQRRAHPARRRFGRRCALPFGYMLMLDPAAAFAETRPSAAPGRRG